MRQTPSFLILSSLLLSCDFLGTEKIDESLLPAISIRVIDVQGNPVSGARVKLFRLPPGDDVNADLSSPVLVADTIVPDGSFRFTSLAPAVYAVAAADSIFGTVALSSRIGTSDLRETADLSLILKAPGHVSGTVTRGPNSLPSGITGNEKILVRLAGTEIFVFTDTAGRCSLDAPEGVYRLAFAAGDGHYLPRTSDSILVVSGRTTNVPPMDLEWSPFVDPPVPAGLIAAPDSDAFVIRLGWRPVKVSNFAHYELTRSDTLNAGNNRTFAVSDTVFSDSVLALPEGRALRYQVRAVNSVGGQSPLGAAAATAVPGPFVWTLDGLVLDLGAPTAAFVRLLAAPAAPGSPDSFPLSVLPTDSLNCGGDGRFQFGPLNGGPYTVEAMGFNGKALRLGLGIHRRGVVAETLSLQATGELHGTASRGSVVAPYVGDEDIQVSLAGTPYATTTLQNGGFSLPDIPPGTYKVVFYAPPEGMFLPDTLSVSVSPGSGNGLTRITARRK